MAQNVLVRGVDDSACSPAHQQITTAAQKILAAQLSSKLPVLLRGWHSVASAKATLEGIILEVGKREFGHSKGALCAVHFVPFSTGIKAAPVTRQIGGVGMSAGCASLSPTSALGDCMRS